MTMHLRVTKSRLGLSSSAASDIIRVLRRLPPYFFIGCFYLNCLFHTSLTSARFHRLKTKPAKKREKEMASAQERQELDSRARQGETVVPGGTGGKSLEAQEHLAEGRSRGGNTRKEQLGHEGYQELGSKGGNTRKEQMGTEGYKEMGKKGGLSTMDKSGGERAEEEGIPIDEAKFRTSA